MCGNRRRYHPGVEKALKAHGCGSKLGEEKMRREKERPDRGYRIL